MKATSILGMVAISCAGCVMQDAETHDGNEGVGGDDGSGEAQEAASEQDIPVTLPHAGPFKIAKGQVLLGRPFHVAAGAQVTVAASASWTNPGCHYPYRVTLRETGIFGGGLQLYTYPSGGAVHTEHWKVPSAGMYRLEIDVDNQPNCRPFAGNVVITSPYEQFLRPGVIFFDQGSPSWAVPFTTAGVWRLSVHPRPSRRLVPS